MAQVKEVELPRRYTIEDIKNILQGIRDFNVLWLRNDVINIKIVRVETGVTIYIVFGERYTFDDSDRGRWDYICYITDNFDELSWFINGL
jgi:hypothetical protein